MKYKVLAVNTPEVIINIGDYIQALASKQFLPSFDGFINREKLPLYTDEKAKVIMNGWYMHHPENWPPSTNIIPLFVSFHINKTTNERMFTEKGIKYLKKFEPIGCRDYNTVYLLNKYNIKAYFSGCMTLTLGETYTSNNKENKYYFVDPIISVKGSRITALKNLVYYFIYKKEIDTLSPHFSINGKSGIRKKVWIVPFYREYSKYFSKEIIMNAEYIHHESEEYRNKFKTDEELLNEAERLVKKYARAKLVVTSRIHCALPCLGLGTPVIFIENSNQNEFSSCRMKGLSDLFNIFSWNNGKINPNFTLNSPITKDNIPKNKSSWKVIAEELKRTVRTFITQ